MKLEHIYYVAALLDGEGYFGYASTPQIQVTSTDLDILKRLQLYMSIAVPINEQSIISEKHKQRYNMNICGVKAIQWMMTIYPLLCKRRKERIKEVLAAWKENQNRTGNLCAKSKHLLEGRNLIIEYTRSGYEARRCRACQTIRKREYNLNRRIYA